MTETHEITLSFAELAFVLSLTATTDGALVCRRLGVPHVSCDDQLASAGLASLALRGLAERRDDRLELSPEVAAVAAAVVTASETATIAVTHDNLTTLTQVFTGQVQSVAVRPAAFGCFRFGGLSDQAALSDVVAALFQAAINDGRSAIVAMINDHRRITAVRRNGSVGVTVDDGAETAVVAADVESAIAGILVDGTASAG